jgi:hypothetical protein
MSNWTEMTYDILYNETQKIFDMNSGFPREAAVTQLVSEFP